jgi:hypothetical protein
MKVRTIKAINQALKENDLDPLDFSPEQVLQLAADVCYFLAEETAESEPQAVNTIGDLKRTYGILQSFRD